MKVITLQIAILIINFFYLSIYAQDFFHQSPDIHKLSTGWQEPGFWRPKWIMERVFTAPDGTIEKVDRVYFKLKPDRTMKICNSRRRTFLEIFRKKDANEEKKKKLFETGDEKTESLVKQFKNKKVDESFFQIDGTWYYADAAPLNFANVKLETREIPKNGNKNSKKELILHDTKCDWGTIDGYCPNFRPGKLYKYKMEAGMPVGRYPVGSFTIKVSPHRPMISKEFLAFQ